MTMARWRVHQSVLSFANKHNMALVTIEDLVAYRQAHERKAS
ncbi:3,4-dihydroxy-2-butanone 4-phosphate synthase [Escherichia coli]|nr:3,4-dihydroxy-2-butanone 4-phosphate synthase [Escherichia coli]